MKQIRTNGVITGTEIPEHPSDQSTSNRESFLFKEKGRSPDLYPLYFLPMHGTVDL